LRKQPCKATLSASTATKDQNAPGNPYALTGFLNLEAVCRNLRLRLLAYAKHCVTEEYPAKNLCCSA
jgi:hypothetical protein